MRRYFISFDYWDRKVNRFLFSIVTVDIDKQGIIDVARKMIEDKDSSVDHESVTIKINAFNLVD